MSVMDPYPNTRPIPGSVTSMVSTLFSSISMVRRLAIPVFITTRRVVTAIALDAQGNIAAATSTGGTLNKAPGRVGDSSLIGCGCYADNRSAAVSTTGWGEPMMKLVLAKWTADRVESGIAPEEAARQALYYLKSRLNGHGGIILVDTRGRIGIAHNTPRMAWAMCRIEKKSAGIKIG